MRTLSLRDKKTSSWKAVSMSCPSWTLPQSPGQLPPHTTTTQASDKPQVTLSAPPWTSISMDLPSHTPLPSLGKS